MRRWLIFFACGLGSIRLPAQVPDPGVMAQDLPAKSLPAINQTGEIRLAQVSSSEVASSVSFAATNESKSETNVLVKATPSSPAIARPQESADKNKDASTLIPKVETQPSLAPPPDAQPPNKKAGAPVAALKPIVATPHAPLAPAPLSKETSDSIDAVDLPKPHTATGPTPLPLPISNRDDGEIRDSIGIVSARPVKDVAEETPSYFQRVDDLRKHGDPILAISYLRQIVTNGDILSQYRSRAILELADSLDSQKQKAESLCWLKIWLELYPTRPEFGAVAYRIGILYRQMGLPDMARDAFYLTLAHSVNQGEVQSEDDLKQYTRLTEGTLWELAANEYQNGQWARAAELFQRYRQEATSASAISQEKAAYLQADCYYQLREVDKAVSLYEEMLDKHPFNPLAPQARLRLYHLYVMKNAPLKAQADLQSLVWTVRTVWPKDETFWQKQTAQLLLALNQKNAVVLPPVFQESAQLPLEGKTWQEALDHYDALVGYQAAATHSIMDKTITSPGKAGSRPNLAEENDLVAMDSRMNQLLPLPRSASNQ